MQPRRTAIPALLIAAALASAQRPALAADAEQNQAAVDLAYEGKERFEAGDYATALDRFEKARTRAGSPVFDLYIARSLKALGRWREALVAYEAAGKHHVEASNVSFRQAQENAASERRELAGKMPKLSLTAPQARSSATVEISIDGDAVAWPVKGIALDPGKHVLAAKLGDETFDEVVTLAAGQNQTIELPFGQKDPNAGTKGGPAEEPRRGLSPLAWTAFGIGAAGLLVGATTGTWALVNMSDLNEHCEGGGCTNGRPQTEPYLGLYNQTAALTTAADIGFIVAGAGAVLGLTFALTLNKGEKAPEQSASLELRPLVGPSGTGLSLGGSF